MNPKLSDHFHIGCSSIWQIMTESAGKTKAQRLAEADAEIVKWREKRDALRDGLKSKETARLKVIEAHVKRNEIDSLPDTPELSQTAKTFCQNWVKQQWYDRRREIKTKYTDKGNLVEQDAIELLEDYYHWGFAVKNTERRRNDFMQGECDVILHDRIIDIKNSYDCFTFPLFEWVIPEAAYEWQIQGYMALWDKPFGEVIYCLMDTPEDIIHREIRWKLGEEFTQEQYDTLYASYIYSNLDMELRVKRFCFERDESKILAVQKRVIECRAYINTLTIAAVPEPIDSELIL